MEEIKFEYPEDMLEEDKLGQEFNFLVNRACAFNKKKFNGIVVPHLDDNDCRYYMLYQAIRIIALTRQVPIYMNRKAKKISWVDEKNINFNFKWGYSLNKMLNKDEEKFRYDTTYEDDLVWKEANIYPRIFAGFTKQRIEDMARVLYGYVVPANKEERELLDKITEALKDDNTSIPFVSNREDDSNEQQENHA